MSERGLARAREERFRWEDLGEKCRLIAGMVVRAHEGDLAERAIAEVAARNEAERVADGLGGESKEDVWRDLGRSEEAIA